MLVFVFMQKVKIESWIHKIPKYIKINKKINNQIKLMLMT